MSKEHVQECIDTGAANDGPDAEAMSKVQTIQIEQDPASVVQESVQAAPSASSKAFAALAPLLRPATPDLLRILSAEFGIDLEAAAVDTRAPTEAALPVQGSQLFVRGDNLILASQTMAKIWCTAKGLQVLEAGLYLFGGVSGSFSSWRPFPEAASVLGARGATRRHLILTSEVLHRLVLQVEDSQAESVFNEHLPEGPVLLGIEPLAALSEHCAAPLGYFWGRCHGGKIFVADDCVATAKAWHCLLQSV